MRIDTIETLLKKQHACFILYGNYNFVLNYRIRNI